MRRPAVYSNSNRAKAVSGPAGSGSASAIEGAAASAPAGGTSTENSSRLARARRYFSLTNIHMLWSVVALLALLLAISFAMSMRPGPRKLTQEDINAAVLKTLENTLLPSPATKAYQTIMPSVVRVVAIGKGSSSGVEKDKDKEALKKGTPQGKDTESGERSVGTGVVIVDKGVILTNLHVVQGAETIKVTFADGLESLATITGVQPENDLAVLQAQRIPDDMIAATMRSTADLRPGDEVLAVGYPFGIGPSASAGVISGLKRNFRSPEGRQEMTNLIQFDAAANPGNSGGPLVTMDGEVIGIVTAIYNPNQQRTFVGIGFAVPIENAASAAGLPPF